MSTIFRASRPAFRARTFFQQNGTKTAGRRFHSTESAAPAESWAQQFWKSEKGPKTVHFWAPMMKWALVLVGVSDFARPAESLSLTQNAALTTTGIIWTRWCLIIKPKNYLLAAVNFFLGCVGLVQCTRILLHQQAQKKLSQEVGEAKETVKEVKEVIKHKSSS